MALRRNFVFGAPQPTILDEHAKWEVSSQILKSMRECLTASLAEKWVALPGFICKLLKSLHKKHGTSGAGAVVVQIKEDVLDQASVEPISCQSVKPLFSNAKALEDGSFRIYFLQSSASATGMSLIWYFNVSCMQCISNLVNPKLHCGLPSLEHWPIVDRLRVIM